MDFMNRGVQQPAHQNKQVSPEAGSSAAVVSKKGVGSFYKISQVVLLFCITLLVVGVLLVLGFGTKSSSDNEASLINSSELQAVFLTNGQVYFGNIKTVSDKYINMTNIYYLTTNQTVQPNTSTSNNSNSNVQLVKLGCELHAPEDQMTINREQVTFWENLKSTGQVAKAVTSFRQQNPNGQNCSSTTSNTTSTTGSTTSTTTKQ